MKMNSASMEPESAGPVATYRIVQWPTHLLSSLTPQPYSSFSDVPEISQNLAGMFEIAQTRDSTDSSEKPLFIHSKLLKKIMERGVLDKTVRGGLSSVSQFQKCPFCQKSFKNSCHWRRHVNMHTGEVKYPCPLCGKIFLDKSTLSRHKKIHSGEKPWRCKMCNKCFLTLASLRRHITVHNPAGRPFKCDICHKRFPDKSSLQKHIFKHSGLRPFSCNVCNKSFVYLGDLNCHMKIHADTKDFVCPHCKKEFIKLGNYQRHVKIHEGKMAHRCPVCHIGYNFQSSLTRHLLVHRQEKLRKSSIICNFCDARFSNRSAVKSHLLRHFAETVENSRIGVQSNNFISKNCDSRNDINKRPLTYREICFVRKNLRYCRVVKLNKVSKDYLKIIHKDQDIGKVCSSSSEEGQNRDDVKSTAVDCGTESLGVSDASRECRRSKDGCADQAVETNRKESDTVGTLKERSRSRQKQLLTNLINSRSPDTRDTTKKVEVLELKSDESAIGKRKRGRPRKVLNIPAKESNKIVDVICDGSREPKRKRGRPRKKLDIFAEGLSQLQKTKNLECRKQKRKRGRPRKDAHICLNKDEQRQQPVGLKFESRKGIFECVKQKKKNVLDEESLRCRSQISSIEVEAMKEITASVAEQNLDESEDLLNLRMNKKICVDADEEVLLEGARTATEKLKTCKTYAVGTGSNGEEHCVDTEAESLAKNSQANKCADKFGKINQKQTEPKLMSLHTVSDDECLQNNNEQFCETADVIERIDAEISIEVQSTDSSFRKERGKYEKQIYDVPRLQEWDVLPEPQKGDKTCDNNCSDSVDLIHTVTHSSENNCYSITLIPQDKLAVVPIGKNNFLKQRAKRKMPIFIIRGNEAVDDGNARLSDKSDVFLEETQFEKGEQTSEIQVTLVDRRMEEALSCVESHGSSHIKHFVADMSEVTYSENMYNRIKPRQQNGYLHLREGTNVTTEAYGNVADETSSVLRPGVKEIILDDWQSDDSHSSASLEEVLEDGDCG